MANARSQFYPLRVRDVTRETPSVVSIGFDVPAALRPLFSFKPGQYLTLKADIDGEDVRRNYSICTAPSDDALRVAIKALPGGRFSTYANHTLRAGDVLDVMPASGHFTTAFMPEQARRYAAFAAGSGITPVLSLIRTALQTEPASRFTLVYGNRHSSDILFLEQLAGLKNRFMARLEVFHCLSAEEDDVALFNGRLTHEKCGEILGRLIDTAATDLFFICGPAGMMQAAETALRDAGVAPAQILLERFAADGIVPGPSAAALAFAQDATGRKIGVVLDGRKSTVAFNTALGSILDNVRAAGLAAPFACKGGVCATCRARVMTGEVTMARNYGLTDNEVTQGYILTCQSTPKTDEVVISYDV